jgi:mono/diheme cytochrome c family protein
MDNPPALENVVIPSPPYFWRTRDLQFSGCPTLSFVTVAIIISAVLLTLAPSGAAAQARPAQSLPPQRTTPVPLGNVQNGKTAFAARMCSTCHGDEGQGSIGPRLAPPGRAYPDFLQYVRQPAGQMPPFTSKAVPDSELRDIYAFLQSIAPASAAPLSENGHAENGKRIYVSDGCYECHGREGQGSAQTAAPRIGPPVLSLTAFASYVHQPTGSMPPYISKVVSDQDLADIYAFLKSVPPPPAAKDIPLLNQ